MPELKLAEYDRVEVVQGDLDAVKIVEAVRGMLDRAALTQLDAEIDAVAQWMRVKLGEIDEFAPSCEAHLGFLPFDKMEGVGRQAVQVNLERDGREILAPGDLMAPTIEVVTPDLIDGGSPYEVRYFEAFPRVRITSLADGLRLDGDEDWKMEIPIGTLNRGRILDIDNSHRTMGILHKDPDRAGIGDRTKLSEAPSKGAYAREYKREAEGQGYDQCERGVDGWV